MEHLGEKVHGGAAAAHGVRLRAVGFEQAALEGTTAGQGGGLENSWLTQGGFHHQNTSKEYQGISRIWGLCRFM